MPLILENAPDTSFTEIGGLFITRFARPSANATEQQTALQQAETPLGTSTEHQEDTKKSSSKSPEHTKRMLLALLGQLPELSVRALAETLGVSQDSARHHLRRLQKENKARRVGPDRGGYWEVVGENE